MPIKFVIGLTDETSDKFLPNSKLAILDASDLIYRETHTLVENDSSIEKATIEWLLDTSLPAVNNLIPVINTIKSKLNITGIAYNKYEELAPEFSNVDFYIEMVNLLPNNDLVLPLYEHADYENIITNLPNCASLELDVIASYKYNNFSDIESIFYAMNMDDLTFLSPGPVDKAVYPAFRINFLARPDNVTNKNMSPEQQLWMTKNKDALEAKGYYINDVKNKIGSLVIGDLIGEIDDAYEKVRLYNKICRVEIIEE